MKPISPRPSGTKRRNTANTTPPGRSPRRWPPKWTTRASTRTETPSPRSTAISPRSRERPLNELPAGRLAAIIHVEDEPQAVHAQLVAEDLHPGMRVRVLESGPDRVRFEADAQEYALAPVVAANLSVLPLPEGQEMVGPFENLSGLKPGERAEIASISANCRGSQRRRMLDLGIIPGTTVECEMNSPIGDPVAYRIRGALIALRRVQAEMIQISEPRTGDVA